MPTISELGGGRSQARMVSTSCRAQKTLSFGVDLPSALAAASEGFAFLDGRNLFHRFSYHRIRKVILQKWMTICRRASSFGRRRQVAQPQVSLACPIPRRFTILFDCFLRVYLRPSIITVPGGISNSYSIFHRPCRKKPHAARKARDVTCQEPLGASVSRWNERSTLGSCFHPP